MPELPEVESILRRVAPALTGRTIRRVTTGADGRVFATARAALKRRLSGRRIDGITREGKYLLLHLDDASRLLLHLGMTGQLLLVDRPSRGETVHVSGKSAAKSPVKPQRPAGPARTVLPVPDEPARGRFGDSKRIAPVLAPVLPGELTAVVAGRADDDERLTRGKGGAGPILDVHTHLCLDFVGGRPCLLFRDVRRFGLISLLEPGCSCERLQKLGTDALGATGAQLYSASRSRKVAIKNLLLNQSVLAGYGNIYADEALFQAGILPTTPCSRLSRIQCARLLGAGKRVMGRAIAAGGSSISDYQHPDGGRGRYQQQHRVYGREGEPCTRCGAPIARTVLGGRSTHFCPRCQR